VADAGSRVVVTGLRDLGKALKEAEDGAQKELALALKGIAEGVASDVRSRVPHRTGRAQASYKPRGSARGASIAFGGDKAPYVPWLEFGGRVGKGKSVKRPVIKGGRYLYPAITDNMQDLEQLVADAIDDITSRYGFKVEGT
jgi:hypothetical protein